MKDKYSFFKLKFDAEKNGMPLPEDVNDFVKKYLVEHGYVDSLPIVDKRLKSLQYGYATVISVGNPERKIRLDTQCGMVTGFDIITEIKTGLLIIEDCTHILNPYLDMSRKRIREDDGQGRDSSDNQ